MYTYRRRSLRPSSVRLMANDAKEKASAVTLNFTLPSKPVCVGEKVFSVRVPGAMGEFGINAGHSPTISELKPGLVRITKEKGSEPDVYFISGGYAVIHEGSIADISAVEAYRVEDLDAAAAKQMLDQVRSKIGDATGEKKAELQIEASVYSEVLRAAK